jgi:hypothetical protein
LVTALGASQLAQAGSSPGAPGTGEKHPVTISPDLQNAKPAPMPTLIVLHDNVNPQKEHVDVGAPIGFDTKNFGKGWTCKNPVIYGDSVQLDNGVFKAVAPGKSVVRFVCVPPPPAPGSAQINIQRPHEVEIDVR